MKKAVISFKKVSTSIKTVSNPNVFIASEKQLRASLQTASPTPVWSRYVDSRLKHFCLR